jgi:hypothetical protein
MAYLDFVVRKCSLHDNIDCMYRQHFEDATTELRRWLLGAASSSLLAFSCTLPTVSNRKMLLRGQRQSDAVLSRRFRRRRFRNDCPDHDLLRHARVLDL